METFSSLSIIFFNCYSRSYNIIGWLWAFPLIYVSNAIFYKYLKNKQQITKAE